MKKNVFVLIAICVLMVNALQAQRTVVQDVPVSITTQPVASAAVCENSGIITIDIAVTGTLPAFQWQEFNPAWANVLNGGIYSGATNDSLWLTNPTLAFNGRQFRAIVTSGGACANSVTSNAVAATVNANPVITAHPSNATACEGTGTTFSVTATGTGLSYQWYENGLILANVGVYSNVTTNTLAISNVTGLNTKAYACVVTGTCGTPVTSNAGILTVNTLVVITTQPVAPVAVCAGTGTQTMTVVGTGTGLTYQWRENGVNITNGGIYSGATTASLTLTAPTTTNNYDVVITGTCSTVTSNVVSNPINALATITSQPASTSVCAAGSLYLTTASFSVATVGPDTYLWQANPGSGWVTATGGVYTNETTTTLNIANATTGMTGTQYRCQITTGAGCVSYTTTVPPVTLTVNPLPTDPTWLISGTTNDTTHYCVGGVTMTLNPTQDASVIYQLQTWPLYTTVGAPQTGNNGIRTWNNIGAGDYVWEITKGACAIRKLN